MDFSEKTPLPKDHFFRTRFSRNRKTNWNRRSRFFRKRNRNRNRPFLLEQYPDLLFLAFSGKGKENHRKKQGFSISSETPKIPGKEGENTQKSKEFLEKQKSKEIKKSKEKEDQGTETQEKPLPERNRRNRKPEPLEPLHPQTVTEPNRVLPNFLPFAILRATPTLSIF